MSYTKDGTDATVQAQSDYTLDQSGTETLVMRFRGLRSDCETLAATYSSYPKTIVQVGDSPLADITITLAGGSTPTDEPISIEWNRRTASIQLPLRQHPNYSAAIDALGPSELKTLNDILEGKTDPADVSWVDSNIDAYIAKYLSGVREFFRPDPQFQYVAKYQAGSSFQPDQADVGVVYSKTTLSSELGIPSDIQAKLQDGEYLCEELDFDGASDGSRVLQMTFRYAVEWDADLYPHV